MAAVLQKWVLAAYHFFGVVQSTVTAKRPDRGRAVRCVIEIKVNLLYMKK